MNGQIISKKREVRRFLNARDLAVYENNLMRSKRIEGGLKGDDLNESGL